MWKLLKKAEELGATFADVRKKKTEVMEFLSTEDRDEVRSNGIDEGYSLRVLYKKNWGYYSSPELLTDDVNKAISSSYGDEKVNIVYLPSKKDKVVLKSKKYVEMSVEEKLKTIRSIKNEILSEVKAKNVSVIYTEARIHDQYLSTEDRDLEVEYLTSGIIFTAGIQEGDKRASAFVSKFSLSDFVLEQDYHELISILKRRIESQLKGIVPKGGEYSVILAPEVTGVFAHEAVGHLAEADVGISGILSKLRGKKIAPDNVSVVDSPLPKEGSVGFVPYDDDGVEGRDAYIIQKGVVKEMLTDRYYSAYLGQRPTGNARAEDYRNPILVRMRNTFIEPGDLTLEEMLQQVKEGFLFTSVVGGETSPDGTFQFGIQEGYRIERGEIKEPLRNTGISGFTIETLSRVKMISKNFEMITGFCGKGTQNVPVGTGGPYILVDKMKVGGSA